MKILLINPPNFSSLNDNLYVNVHQAIGLAYLGAILEKHHYQVKILDALAEAFCQQTIKGNKKIIGLNKLQIKKIIKEESPDVVGISMPFSYQASQGHSIARLVKRINPNIIVVAGGVHPTILPNQVMKDVNIDYVVRGEGEYIFLQLINSIKNKKNTNKIKSLSYRNKKSQIINNPKDTPIIKLDELPFPARHLLPMKSYHQAAIRGRANESLLAYGKKRTSIFTSRGCPYNCTFCNVKLTMGQMWRKRSPDNVVEEIKECVNKYKIKYFDILDDNFSLDKNRAKQICKLIIKNKLKIKWSTPNGIRADSVDEELIILMKKAGCIQLKIAPESGNQCIVNQVIKKNLDLKKVENVVKLAKKHKISIEAFFVIGFPQETKKDILKSISYAKNLRRLGCDYCYFFIATPYQGTEMYQTAVDHNWLIKNYDITKISTTGGDYYFNSPNFTKKELFDLKALADSINPPVTKNRIIPGLIILLIDPKRIINHAYFCLKNIISSKKIKSIHLTTV